MRLALLALIVTGVLAGCGIVGGSDETTSTIDVDAVEDVNADLASFRCTQHTAESIEENEANGGDDEAGNDEANGDQSAEETSEESAEDTPAEGQWDAVGWIENTSPLARSYLVTAYAGDPGVEVEASTTVVSDVPPNEGERFEMSDVEAVDGASQCYVRVEQYGTEDEDDVTQ